MKFAKLFDVEDTQVLMEVKADADGEPAITVKAMIGGSIVEVAYTMDGATDNEAWDMAYKNLELADHQAAIEVFQVMKAQVPQLAAVPA